MHNCLKVILVRAGYLQLCFMTLLLSLFVLVSFSLQNVLLQSEEELMAKRTSELASEGAAMKPRKTIGKMKVQGM